MQIHGRTRWCICAVQQIYLLTTGTRQKAGWWCVLCRQRAQKECRTALLESMNQNTFKKRKNTELQDYKQNVPNSRVSGTPTVSLFKSKFPAAFAKSWNGDSRGMTDGVKPKLPVAHCAGRFNSERSLETDGSHAWYDHQNVAMTLRKLKPVTPFTWMSRLAAVLRPKTRAGGSETASTNCKALLLTSIGGQTTAANILCDLVKAERIPPTCRYRIAKE